jgi:hypothetical protein
VPVTSVTFERLNVVTNFIEVAVELLGREDRDETLISENYNENLFS